MKSIKINGVEYHPYCQEVPRLKRPRTDLARPRTDEEKLYCWYYWLETILNPATTRMALDSIDRVPEFKVNWGASWKKGHKLFEKTSFNDD